ncbi:unnamed protein product, partial [Medioppia subpectinata]
MLSTITRQLVPQLVAKSRLPAIRCVSSHASEPSTGYSFGLTEDQQQMVDMAKKFTREEIMPKARHHDETGEYPIDIIKKAHALGLMTTSIPEEYGGQGLSLVDHCL